MGQLGDGTTTDRYTPVQVVGLSGVTAITAGASHSLALQPSPRLAWDVNGDHLGDIADVALIGLRWQVTGAPGWIPEDANADGIVDIADVALVGTHWFETW